MSTTNSVNANATTPLIVGHGGTGVTSVTTAPTASSFAGWDANSNLSANNLLEGYTTTATATGTTTLTVSSTYYQFFTGSSNQTLVLPVASTLVVGQSFYVINNATNGSILVNTSGGNAVTSVLFGNSALFTCILASGTGTASWSAVSTVAVTYPLAPSKGGTGVNNNAAGTITTNGIPLTVSGFTSGLTLTGSGTPTVTFNGSGTVAYTTNNPFTNFVTQSSFPFTATINTSYVISNGASLAGITMPSSGVAPGATLMIIGGSSGGWQITAQGGTTIRIGNAASSSGGTASSTNQYDSLFLMYVGGFIWQAVLPPQGNITLA